MLTTNEVKQLLHQLRLENASSLNDGSIDDIECIIYRNDTFECGSTIQSTKHIDIEFIFGEYYEIAETSPLFQFICTLGDFPHSEQEWILYQREFQPK